MLLWATCKSSLLSIRLKSQRGRSQLFHSTALLCWSTEGEECSILLFPEAIVGEHLICQATASQSNGSFILSNLLSILIFTSFTWDELFYLWSQYFPVLMTRVYLPPLMIKWCVNVPCKEQCQQRELLETPPRNTKGNCVRAMPRTSRS